MKKLIQMQTNLTDREIKEFNHICESIGESPARKIGELVHGFLVSEGVKHRAGLKVA